MPSPGVPATRPPLARVVCLVLVLLVAMGQLAQAQASSASDGLDASLLTTTDLPGFVGRDVEDPTDFDIDRVAFDERQGIEVRIRAWVSQDEGVVFDHRMLFPSHEAALAYLAAAEPTLSEADVAGLVLVTEDPLTTATRHWAGETRTGSERVAMDVWLIPVGPVLAKVAVTLFGPGLDTRRLIPERALARLQAVYGSADTASPPGSPAGPRQSPPPGSPAAPGQASPLATVVPDIELLQRLVQAVLRTGARGCDGDSLQPSLPGEVVAMSCTNGDVVVVYRQFAEADARDAAYASLVDQVPEPDGTATSCAEGAYQGSVMEGERTWSIACWESSSGLVLLWTEPDQATLGAILAPPFSDLMALWRAVRFRDPID